MTDAQYKHLKSDRDLADFVTFLAGLTKYVVMSENFFLKKSEKIEPQLDELRAAFEKLGGASLAYISYKNTMAEMTLCRGVDNFLCYIADLMRMVFEMNPDMLKSNEKISYSEILGHESLESLKLEMIENKIFDLSNKGFRVLAKELEEKYGFTIYRNQDHLENIVELVEIRNLIVHNRGIVNAVFKERVPKSLKSIGEKLVFDFNQDWKFMDMLNDSFFYIDNVAEEKFKLPRSERVFEKSPLVGPVFYT